MYLRKDMDMNKGLQPITKASVSCILVSGQPPTYLFYYRMKLPLWPLFHHMTSFYFK